MDQEKKPAASPAANPAPKPLPAAPVGTIKPGVHLSRETTFGMMVAGVFIALVAGVVLTKTVFKALAPAHEEQTMAQAPPINELPFSQPVTKAPAATPTPPLPAAKAPAMTPTPPPAFAFDPPPTPATKPAPVESLAIPEPPVTSAPKVEPIDLKIPDVGATPVPAPPITTVKSDPTLVLPPMDDLPPLVRTPGRDDPFTASPPPDTSVPRATNPIIQVGTDAKKDAPPKSEPAPMSKNEVPMFDPPPMIEPPPAIKVDAPPKLDIKLDPPATKTDTPKVDPKIAPPVKVDTPPITIEPPVKVDTPIDPPAKKEMPPKLNLPDFDPPMKKDTPPAAIDLAPMPKADPPAPVSQPKIDAKKDGDYDEDMHSLKQNETYRSISKQYYNSDAYAIALQRYNRDHPGQADYVRIPPIWLLEKKYSDDIAANQARPVNYSPIAAEAAPRNDAVYTVSDNGELLADIARKQLGSEDAWKRIWDLNPQLNPAKTVPGGTRLRLPGQ